MSSSFVLEESYVQEKSFVCISESKTRPVMSVPKLAVLLKLRIVVDAGGRRPGLEGAGVGEALGKMFMLLLVSCPAPPPLMVSPLPLREPPLGLSVGEALGTSLGGGMLETAGFGARLAIPGGGWFFGF